VTGEPCEFSAAGPTLTGLFKPDILAPGAAIVGALSQQALPSSTNSIFNVPCAFTADGGVDTTCQEVDALHAVSYGTSFSSPLVAGAAALLMQRHPDMTQDDVRAALQGGAHALRSPSRFEDQAGAGELDVAGAIAAADREPTAPASLPDAASSWIVVGADAYLADGHTPLEGVLQLRVAGGVADGFAPERLTLYAKVNGKRLGQWPCVAVGVPGAACWRRGPGVWVFELRPDGGLGGQTLTLGATFDGIDIALPRSLPIATDVWNAEYPPTVTGGCTLGRGSSGLGGLIAIPVWIALALGCRRRAPTRPQTR